MIPDTMPVSGGAALNIIDLVASTRQSGPERRALARVTGRGCR
jgi:hypothetical protein